MEFFREQVRAFAHDQTSIVRPVRQDVDKALQTPEAGLLRVLVLMWPGDVGLHVGTVGKSKIEPVEGHDQILCVVDSLECGNDTWFLTDVPGERFMGDAISRGTPHQSLGTTY
jgi:hypothetical protein